MLLHSTRIFTHWTALGAFTVLSGFSATVHAEHLGPRGEIGSFRIEAPATRTVSTTHGEIALSKLGAGAKTKSVLSGELSVADEGDYVLIAFGDGGVQIDLADADGKPARVFEASAPRSYFAAGDAIPVHLTSGVHTLRVTISKGTAFGLRVVGADLAPARGVRWTTPDTPPDKGDLQISIVGSTTGELPLRVDPTPRFDASGVRLRLHVSRARISDAELQAPLEIEVKSGERVLFSANAGTLPTPRAETTITLPPLPVGPLSLRVRHGERQSVLALKLSNEAVRAIVRARAAASAGNDKCKPGSIDSVEHLADVLEAFVLGQENDPVFLNDTVRELDELSAKLEAGADPYEGREGPQRRALRSPVDGQLHEFGFYVPKGAGAKSPAESARAEKKPLILVLHGLHGRPMTMLRYLFGGDDKNKPALWKDRHWDPSLPTLDAFAIAPSGHGDAMYRWLAEDESLRLIEWAQRVYGVDPDRVTMTGASMGGIGAAAIPFHHPGVFAAAAPLCGYHSYFLRSDVAKWSRTPYERFLAEERSNVSWAENGHDLPLFIAHGTQDLPEANSGVLIDRYEQLHYRVVHEHPNVGHNVWQPTYENLKGARWLLQHTRKRPTRLHLRTVRPRYGDSSWLHVGAQERSGEWTEVRARFEVAVGEKGAKYTLTTSNVRELTLDRSGEGSARVEIDGSALDFTASEALTLHKHDGSWRKGSLDVAPAKRGPRTGPFRDLYHEPLVFVVGTRDPRFTAVNREVAEALARVRNGVRVSYPILRDDQADGRIAKGTSVVLIGPASSNSWRARYDAKLPSHVDANGLRLGERSFTGAHVGAAYVYPHPDDADAYLAVVEGVDPLGVRGALALPELVPDFVVWDDALAPARGGILLGRGKTRAAGYFSNDWSVPRE